MRHHPHPHYHPTDRVFPYTMRTTTAYLHLQRSIFISGLGQMLRRSAKGPCGRLRIMWRIVRDSGGISSRWRGRGRSSRIGRGSRGRGRDRVKTRDRGRSDNRVRWTSRRTRRVRLTRGWSFRVMLSKARASRIRLPPPLLLLRRRLYIAHEYIPLLYVTRDRLTLDALLPSQNLPEYLPQRSPRDPRRVSRYLHDRQVFPYPQIGPSHGKARRKATRRQSRHRNGTA